MKRILFVLSLIGIVTISCEKSPKDEILFTDIIPDKKIQSVDHFIYFTNPFKVCTIPIPNDSAITYLIDMDYDDDDDFKITVSHFDEGYSHEHCVVYTFYIMLDAISPNESIATKPLKFNDIINDQNEWSEHLYLYVDNSMGYPPSADFTDCYIGIKVLNNYGYIKVSKLNNNGIIVEEYAINKTENADIICGQKE